MKFEIKKYNSARDYERLLKLLHSEGPEWASYLTPVYQKSLERSITYVAYLENDLCGYSRSINDPGFFVWVVDLLVNKKYRGNSIGKKLMECICIDFPDQDVYVMSDVDEYYKKSGYKKEGSIFKVNTNIH